MNIFIDLSIFPILRLPRFLPELFSQSLVEHLQTIILREHETLYIKSKQSSLYRQKEWLLDLNLICL